MSRSVTVYIWNPDTTGYYPVLPARKSPSNPRDLQRSLAICSIRTAILQHAIDLLFAASIYVIYMLL
eukprot:1157929-Amorphochlora_amoeboformis.AAC.1